MNQHTTRAFLTSTKRGQKMTRRFLMAGFVGMFFFGIAACDVSNNTPTDAVYTQQAMTLMAVLTDAALPAQPATEASTEGAPSDATLEAPTETGHEAPTDILTVIPTITSIPTVTQNAIPCLRADFVSDVTIPDNSKIDAGQTFRKTWKVRNSGSCAWTSDFILGLVSNERMGGSNDVLGVNVPVGAEQDLSVSLIAPSTAGIHIGYWKLRNPQGTWFGTGISAGDALYVKIQVIGGTPSVTPTPSETRTPTGPTNTPTETRTQTPSKTPTVSLTPTPSLTPTCSAYPCP
jgi:hypothetical protein